MDPRPLALAQGTFYLAGGLWPILHLRSFEAITGPKPEGWLVKTVGALVAIAGGAMISAGARDRVTPEIAGLAAGSAAALGTIDVVYALRGRISPIYLADAVIEAALVAAWLLPRTRRAAARAPPFRAGRAHLRTSIGIGP